MHNLMKLTGYECKRIVKTKTYLFLTVISLAYSIFVLRTQTLFGAYNTAPYSQWSFISYLHTIMPMLYAILVILISQQFGKKEKQIQMLTLSTQTSYRVQKTGKAFALGIIFCMNLVLCVVAMYLYFAFTLKHIASFDLLLCALLFALPQFLLIAGLGLWFASYNANAVYLLLIVITFLTIANIRLPMIIDFIGNSILAIPATSIPNAGVIPYVIPPAYLFSRIGFAVIGMLLLIFACRKKRKLI